MVGLVLASCGFIFSPQSAWAQTCSTASSAYQEGDGSCASGNFSAAVGRQNTASGTSSAAMGRLNTASGPDSVALGVSNMASGGTTIGSATALGVQNIASGIRSTAVGYDNDATHDRSSAFGFRAMTTAVDQMVFGSVAGRLGNRNYGATTYRFAGLSLTGTGQRTLTVDAEGDLVAVAADLGAIATNTTAIATNATAISNTTTLLGSASQDGGGTATVFQRIADVRATSSANAATIDALDTRLTQRANTNAAGVAMGNALSAVPNTLPQGKRILLGIGAGSFDGKSAMAIGVTRKFGASTINGGAAVGDGETSFRAGIYWTW